MTQPYGDVDECKCNAMRGAVGEAAVTAMYDDDSSGTATAATTAFVCGGDGHRGSVDDGLRSIKVVLSGDVREGARLPRTLRSLDELRQLICSLPHCPRSYALDTARQLTTPPSMCAAATTFGGDGGGCGVDDVAATAPGDCAWVHCKHFTGDELSEALSWLPLHPSTVHRMLHYRDVTEDVVEYYPSHGYVYAQLRACVRHGDDAGEAGEARVPLLLVAYDTLLFSYCAGSFDGEGDALFDAMLPSDTAAAAATATTAATFAASLHSGLDSHNGSIALATVASGGSREEKEDAAANDEQSSHTTRRSTSMTSLTRRNDGGGGGGGVVHNVGNVFSALVYTVVLRVQRRVTTLLMQADHLDELMLQIQPSAVDQNDLLCRVKAMRHRVARLHVELLLKERLLKHLLLLPMLLPPDASGSSGSTTTAAAVTAATAPRVCCDAVAVARYQLAASAARRSIEQLRRARDLVNASSMNLISGVSARLLSHCYHMDYLNNVQTQISLVLMPISVLPALWASNVKVPWQDLDSLKPFYGLTAITLGLTALAVGYFCIRFFTFKMPGAIVTTFE